MGTSFRPPNRGAGQRTGPGTEAAIPAPQHLEYFVNGQLDPQLLDEKAETVAKELKEVSSSQLRRFYGDLMTLRRRLEIEAGDAGSQARQEAFERLRADFKMLKAKAVYARGREGNKFPEVLLRFFVNHVHSVKTAEDFLAFCRHFEAVVALHKFYGRRD